MSVTSSCPLRLNARKCGLLISSSVNFTSSALNGCAVVPGDAGAQLDRAIPARPRRCRHSPSVGTSAASCGMKLPLGIDVPQWAEHVPMDALIHLDMRHQRVEHRRLLRQADDDLAGGLGGRLWGCLRCGATGPRRPGGAGNAEGQCLATRQQTMNARRPNSLAHVSPRFLLVARVELPRSQASGWEMAGRYAASAAAATATAPPAIISRKVMHTLRRNCQQHQAVDNEDGRKRPLAAMGVDQQQRQDGVV